MVRLKFKLVEEKPEEVAGGQAESALKVRDEDDVLARLQIRRVFAARDPAFHPFRDAPSPDQPVDLGLGDVGTLLGGSGGSLHHPLLDELDGGGLLGRHLGGVMGQRTPVACGNTAVCCKEFTGDEQCITMVEKEKRK